MALWVREGENGATIEGYEDNGGGDGFVAATQAINTNTIEPLIQECHIKVHKTGFPTGKVFKSTGKTTPTGGLVIEYGFNQDPSIKLMVTTPSGNFAVKFEPKFANYTLFKNVKGATARYQDMPAELLKDPNAPQTAHAMSYTVKKCTFENVGGKIEKYLRDVDLGSKPAPSAEVMANLHFIKDLHNHTHDTDQPYKITVAWKYPVGDFDNEEKEKKAVKDYKEGKFAHFMDSINCPGYRGRFTDRYQLMGPLPSSGSVFPITINVTELLNPGSFTLRAAKNPVSVEPIVVFASIASSRIKIEEKLEGEIQISFNEVASVMAETAKAWVVDADGSTSLHHSVSLPNPGASVGVHQTSSDNQLSYIFVRLNHAAAEKLGSVEIPVGTDVKINFEAMSNPGAVWRGKVIDYKGPANLEANNIHLTLLAKHPASASPASRADLHAAMTTLPEGHNVRLSPQFNRHEMDALVAGFDPYTHQDFLDRTIARKPRVMNLIECSDLDERTRDATAAAIIFIEQGKFDGRKSPVLVLVPDEDAGTEILNRIALMYPESSNALVIHDFISDLPSCQQWPCDGRRIKEFGAATITSPAQNVYEDAEIWITTVARATNPALVQHFKPELMIVFDAERIPECRILAAFTLFDSVEIFSLYDGKSRGANKINPEDAAACNLAIVDRARFLGAIARIIRSRR